VLDLKIKRITGIVAGILIMALFSACSITNEVKVVATVNNEEITMEDFNYYLSSVKAQMEYEASQDGQTDMDKFWKTEIEGKKAVDIAKEKALEEAVKYKVQVLKAKELGLTVDENDEKQIKEQKDNMIKNIGSRKGYDETLKQYGLNDAKFTEMMRGQVLIGKLQQMIVNDEEPMAVSEQELRDYYENNKTALNRIKAKHILFKTVDENQQPFPEEQQEEVKKKAEEVYNRIKAGEDFDTLMYEFSEDPGLQTSPDGYVFGKGEMVKPFEDAAYALKPGEISELVKSDYGYHIIKREELSFEDVKTNNAIKIDISIDKLRKNADIQPNEKVLSAIKVN